MATISSFNPDTQLFHWEPISQIEIRIPDEFLYWIMLPGSLTQALKSRSDHFSVTVLEQSYVTLYDPPSCISTQSRSCRFFSRKVRLNHHETPWVAAHTLVPETSLLNGLEQLTQLKNKPLGELLFSTPGVTKDTLQACKTSVGWGRRARYLLNNQPLLVSEFFLPDLINYERKNPRELR